MILLDENAYPQNTVIYISMLSLRIIRKNNFISIDELFVELVNCDDIDNLNFEFVVLAVDFLFLIGKIGINEGGEIFVY